MLFKALLIFFVPFAAFAAEQQIEAAKTLGPEDVAFKTWLFILILSTTGWAVSQLDKATDILVKNGRTSAEYVRGCLVFAQSLIASNLLGVMFYFAAKGIPEKLGLSRDTPEMVVFMGVAFAGWASIAGFEWVRSHWVSKVA